VSTKTLLEMLGDEVKERRTQRSLNQEELAHKAGVHTNVIGRLERGETNSQVLTLFDVAMGLKAPLAELIAGVEAKLTAGVEKRR